MSVARPSAPRAMRAWRIGLVVVGLGLLGIGGLVLLDSVNPTRYVGILAWMAGAIIVHDGIIAPIVFVVALGMRRAGKKIPSAVIAILQGAIVLGAIVGLIVLPEVIKKSLGTANPTVLPLDYGFNLIVFYAIIAVVTAVVIAAYLAMAARRQKERSASIHD